MYKINDYSQCHEKFSIERLKELLETDTIEPRFDVEGLCEKHECCEAYHFFGNFVHTSFVFNFSTKDKALIKELKRLIDKNISSEEYKRVKYSCPKCHSMDTQEDFGKRLCNNCNNKFNA